MADNLRSNPGKLKNINYSVPQEGDSWTPDYFLEAYEGARGLAAVDVSSPEGLKKFYSVVTDPSVKGWDSETVGKAQKALVGMVNSGLARNSLKNIGGLAGLLDSAVATNLDFSFPGFYAADSSEPYKKAAQAITRSQEVAQDVEESPDEYFKKRVEGVDDSSKAFWFTLREQVLRADVRVAQREAVLALKAYGSPNKYLAENVATGSRLAQEFGMGQEKLQKEMQEAYQKRAEELGGDLTAKEQIELDKSFEGKQKEFSDKYRQGAAASQVMGKMIGKVQEIAHATLKKKKEDSSAAKSKK